jgi:transcriptional regulator with XRE-family HTH domain
MRLDDSRQSIRLASEAQSLGVRIRQAREEQGLRQDELAFAAGVSRRLLQQAEAGKSTVRLDSLWKILQVLGLRLEIVPKPLRRAVPSVSGDQDE